MYGFENAGARPADKVSRALRLNQAIARDAVHCELAVEDLCRIAPFRVVRTEARDKQDHLNSPARGARLDAASARELMPDGCDVQIVVADGLSAEAVHHNAKDLLPVLQDGLAGRGIRVGRPILARYGRVKLAEAIADAVECALVVLLIGERPGGDALSSCSLSAYLAYRIADPAVRALAAEASGNPGIRFEYTVISNIYAGGLPPVEAGSVIAEKSQQILALRAAGNRLEALLKGAGRPTARSSPPSPAAAPGDRPPA